MSTITKLCKYIKAHGHQAWVIDGELFAVTVWVDSRGDSWETVETVQPTFAAVSEWLGY